MNPGYIRDDGIRRQRMREDRRTARIVLVLWIIFCTAIIWLCVGCSAVSTVTPDRVESSAPSFDGNEQNSGVIASTPTGFVVTSRFRDRYNALVATYGRDFAPALRRDAGISRIDAGQYAIDKEHMVKFLTMNAWQKAQFAPLRQ
jgi:hypothetical protein